MLVLAVIVVFALSGVNVYAGVWTSFVFLEVCVFLGLTFIPKVSKRYRGVNQVGCILCEWLECTTLQTKGSVHASAFTYYDIV